MQEIQLSYKDAGDFCLWLKQFRQALFRDEDVKVPCGACRACCTSSYFILIRPFEIRTFNRIPKAFLVPAPHLPKGHKILGFNEQGHCPMFIGNACSIYKDRPLTCRTYDCRIFAATGITAGNDKSLIRRQVNRWRFDLSAPQAWSQFTALQKAAEFLYAYTSHFPEGFIPKQNSQIAILAIKTYDIFFAKRGIIVGNLSRNEIQETVESVIQLLKPD